MREKRDSHEGVWNEDGGDVTSVFAYSAVAYVVWDATLALLPCYDHAGASLFSGASPNHG